MFLTLCYALLTLFLERQRNRVSRLLKDNIERGSVVFHYVDRCRTPSVSSSVHNPIPRSVFCDTNLSVSQRSLLEEGSKAATFLFPKQKIDLQSWIQPVFLPNKKSLSPPRYVTILVEAVHEESSVTEQSDSTALQVEDYCIPQAWKSDDVFGLIGQASLRELSILCTAFLNNHQLQTQNMEVKKIMTVDVEPISLNADFAHGESSTMLPSWSYSTNRECMEIPAHHLVTASEENVFLGPPDWCPDEITDGLGSVEFPLLETLDKEYYGGSNESLAEKVAVEYNIPLEESDETDSDYEEGLSSVSNASNEACAGSQGSSPLKVIMPARPSCLPLRSSEYVFHSVLDGYCDEAGETMAATPDSPYVPSCDTTPSSGFHSDGTSLQNKPPNILIYTGEDYSFCSQFIKIKTQVEKIVDKNSYVIYLLPEVEASKNPWKENTCLLIVACRTVSDSVAKVVLHFLEEGGKVFFHCTNFSLPSKQVTVQQASTSIKDVHYKSQTLPASLTDFVFKYDKDSTDVRPLGFKCDTKEPVIIEVMVQETGGKAILSQACLFDNDEIVGPSSATVLNDILRNHLDIVCTLEPEIQHTPAFLYPSSQSVWKHFMSFYQRKHGDKIIHRGTVLHMVEDLDAAPCASSQYLPILMPPNLNQKTNVLFDMEQYFSNLHTTKLGKLLLFSEVITTTMTVAEGLAYDGLVAVAHHQSEGKGRGKNAWLSPKGCAMFTVHFHVPLSSQLGQKISFLQHLTTISVIQGICNLAGYENLNLKLKWPNDIYFGRDVKLGGAIVTSVLTGGELHVSIGVGLNVSNSKPTTCINDLIRQYNQNNGASLEELTIEEVIARSLTCLEKLMDKFEIRGVEAILPYYYEHWLHNDQEVTLGDTGEPATIVGLDDYGFLKVKTKAGSVVAVQPDGNSFDMVQNLIRSKPL